MRRARISIMTVVLVHGNPEAEATWGQLVYAIGRADVVRLSPPGFGAPLPDGFPATYLAYRDWLEGELAGFDEPVDVVGHDWGGGHVVNAMMHRPELAPGEADQPVRGRRGRRAQRGIVGKGCRTEVVAHRQARWH
jgi:pimeloyl-ACP methyl ester carboxylesterase